MEANVDRLWSRWTLIETAIFMAFAALQWWGFDLAIRRNSWGHPVMTYALVMAFFTGKFIGERRPLRRDASSR